MRCSVPNVLRYSRCGLLASALLTYPQAHATDAMQPGLYEVIAETVMPHLEEGLRYATTRERRCLSEGDLASAFPMLSHDAMKGCALGRETRHEESVSYRLVCQGRQETTGTAQWLLGPDRVTGRLDVRLGGKNMTFSQRVTANRLGDCVRDAT